MNRAIFLGKLFGIQIRIHYTWFIIFFLLTFLLVEPDYQSLFKWVVGICTSAVFFISVLAHELAHSLVGRANGIPVSDITLFIFGGMATMEKEATNPGAEIKMAAAGPICSLALAVVFGLIWMIPGITGYVAEALIWLAVTNGILALFNLIPGFPLDGGRIFRSLIWKSTGSYLIASHIAAIIGYIIGWLFILFGIFVIIFRPFGMSWGNGLWLSIIGWFLFSMASSGYRSIRRENKEASRNQNPIITDVEYKVIDDDKDQQD